MFVPFGRFERDMRKFYQYQRVAKPGFALVATISVLVLLVMIALAMLSLSSIEIRSSGEARYRSEARANVRMALMLAVGALQESMGPDQRVSADASVLDSDPKTEKIEGVGQPDLLGVWDSWSPGYSRSPEQVAMDYDGEKELRFRRWLISHPDSEAVKNRDYALSVPALGGLGVVAMYSENKHGYSIQAPLIGVAAASGKTIGSMGRKGAERGSYAWHIRQENTRALVSSHAYEGGGSVPENVGLVAPRGVGYGLDANFKDDAGNDLADILPKVLSQAQLPLAKALTSASFDSSVVWPHFTTRAVGLHTDVVRGGLKRDLSLAFELPDAAFQSAFNGSFTGDDAGVTQYKGQKNLYTPIVTDPEQVVTDPFPGLNYDYHFRVAHVPTFDSLRSYHRLYRHLYTNQDQLTAYQRQVSNISWNPRTGTGAGVKSETGLMPVMDRVFFYFSVDLASDGIPRIIITPLVTLWNPYNVSLDCRGFDIYPWMDFPYQMDWEVKKEDGSFYYHTNWMSNFLTRNNEGRMLEPYFHLALTADGLGVNPSKNLHFAPGEVKLFCPSDPNPQTFHRFEGDTSPKRRILMRPASAGGLVNSGGFAVQMNWSAKMEEAFTYHIQPFDQSLTLSMIYMKDYSYPYHVTMEDLNRLNGSVPNKIMEVQVLDAAAITDGSYHVDLRVDFPIQLKNNPRTMSVQETYHRTARGKSGKQASDLFYAVNPRQSDMTLLLLGGVITQFASAPHYVSHQQETREIPGTVFPTLDGETGFYGLTNAPVTGKSHLPVFEVPRVAPLSLASLTHADLANTTYSPSHQIGNGMSTPYLSLDTVARIQKSGLGRGGKVLPVKPGGFPVYDHSYLLNEVLWDGYFYSSAAPVTQPRSGTGGPGVYDSDTVEVTSGLDEVLSDFVKNPSLRPLRNRREILYTGGESKEAVIARLSGDDGFRQIARYLLLDGAFNINSTSVPAWSAVLASARGADVTSVKLPSGSQVVDTAGKTPFTRMDFPIGMDDDLWTGFRSLTDDQVRKLAEKMVTQVKKRGPFLSVGEFVNRRVVAGELGKAGTIQAAINQTTLNDATKYDFVETTNFPYHQSYIEDSTGVGTPGYFSQVDVLHGLGNSITARSDTFVIRCYGDSRNAAGKVMARAWCEAVVQRIPEWTDTTQDPATRPADWSLTNRQFGRQLKVVSFRFLHPSEISP